MALASATPMTLNWHTMTKNRFSAMFSAPAMDRYISGFLVSPMALNTALPKLYKARAGIPRKYTRRYRMAPGSRSSLVFSSRSMKGEPSRPTNSSTTPAIRLTMAAEWTVFSTSCSCRAP